MGQQTRFSLLNFRFAQAGSRSAVRLARMEELDQGNSQSEKCQDRPRFCDTKSQRFEDSKLPSLNHCRLHAANDAASFPTGKECRTSNLIALQTFGRSIRLEMTVVFFFLSRFSKSANWFSVTTTSQ